MKVIVHDASVLIDLIAADLLEQWLGLGNETIVTSLVWREINRKSEKEKLQPYVERGLLKIAHLPSEDFSEVVAMKMDLSLDLSLEDVSALYVAVSRKGILLTGEKTLRQNAERRGVEVHGLLWVFDVLIERGKMLASIAADRLEHITAKRTSRLPKEECSHRIKKWRSQ